MAITPGPGYQIDPNNPNGVVPIGSSAQAQGLGVYNAGTSQSTAQNLAGQLDSTLPNGGVNANAPLQTPGTMAETPNPNSATTSSATFPGVVSNLANTSAAGSTEGQKVTNQLATTSANSSSAATAAQQATAQAGLLNAPLAQNAANTASEFGQMGQTALNAAAPQLAGLATMGGGPIGLGQAGAIQNTVANYLQGLNSAESLQLNPNAQELTAANQQASAEANAGNLANTQQANIQSGLADAGNLANTAQANIQSGLTSAGQLTQPSGTYPFVFNPATGSFTTSGTAGGTSGNIGLTLNPSTDISAAVSAITANPSSYSSWESAITSGYGSNGSTIAGQLNAALLQAGLNPTNLAAESTQSASNVSTAGGAQSTAWNSVLQSATSNISTYSTALNNINTLGGSAGTLLATLPSGAASNPQLLNSTINGLATQFNSPQYAQFNAMIAGLQRAVSGYISQGEIPTNATQSAQAIVNPNTTVQALLGALTGFNSDMQAAISANQTTATAAQKQLNQAASTNPSGGSGTSSTGTGWGSITYGTQ